MALIDQVFSILANSKNILELPTASTASGADWAVIWNSNTNRAEKIKVSNFTGQSNWIWIDDCWVAKGAGNTDKENLEVNDVVYFKPITNGGDPLTLVGFTYTEALSGDEQLIGNYSQNQAITT